MDILKDIGAAIPGGVTDLGFDWLNNEAIGKPNMVDAYRHADRNSAKSFKRSYEAYRNRFQTTVLDMKKAGLNPILAASGGFQVGGQPSANVNAAIQPPAPTGEGTHSARNLGETAVSREEAKEKVARVAKIREETVRTLQETTNLRARTGVIKAEERKILKQILEIEERIFETFTRAQLNKERILTDAYVRDNYKFQTKKLKWDVAAMRAQLKELERIAEVYEGPAGGFIKYLKELMNALGITTIVPVGIPGGKTKLRNKERRKR